MATSDSLPRRLGPYVLEAQLGRGGMGTVYRARTHGGGLVAIKLIRGDMLGDTDVRRRFAREARAAARLQHPNIAMLLDFGTWGGETAIVMELVDGIPMTSWRHHPPDGASLHAVMRQILGALAHAHARGVVHRDLKPENIMVAFAPDGQPLAKIMDFGVAHFREERVDGGETHVLIGTPAYMSPEQALRAADVSPSADLYAVGVMLFEFVTGRLPFDAKSVAGQLFAHLHNPVPDIEVRDGLHVTGPFDQLVRRLLAKKPAERYLFAIDALRILERCTFGGLPRSEATPVAAETGAAERDTVLRRPGRPTADSPAVVSGSAPFALFALRDPPFRGRDDDLLELKALANDAVSAEAPRVAIVVGEPGIGKSRLVTMLLEHLEETGTMQVWRSQCEEGSDEVLRDALRRGLGVVGLPTADTSLRLRELLDRHGISDPWEHATMLEFVGPPETRAASQRLKHENARWALVERVLLRAATERPVALVLEDVHLSDGAALRFADWMLTSGGTRPPCLIVLTCRPDAASGTRIAEVLDRLRQRDDSAVRVLQLPRLDLRAMQTLVRDAVPVDPAISSGIAMRAGGNPLLAVETIRHLIDSGRLENHENPPTVEEVLLDLPVGLGEIVVRRLLEAARSPDADERTLEAWMRLAVLGNAIPEALVDRLLCDAGGLPLASRSAALLAGVATGVLREDSPGVLRFDNQHARETLVAMARREGRLRELHRAAATALLGHGASASDESAGEIARHLSAAGEAADAMRWHVVDAERATRRKAFEHALAAWTAAAELARDSEPRDPAALERALLGAAEAQLHLGRFDATLALVDESRNVNTRPGARSAEATRLLAEVAARQGNLREARALFAAASHGFEFEQKPLRQAWAEVGLAGVELRDGQVALAEQVLLRARERFAAHQDIHGEATVLLMLGRCALDTGLEAEAAEFARKGHRRHGALGDRHGAALCILLEGEIALAGGNAPAANDAFDRARGELLAAGDRHGAARASYMLGVVAEAGGRESRARSLFREALRTFEQLGDQQYGTLSRLALARLDAETGAWEAAEPAIERVLERDAEERNDDGQFVTLLVETARLALLAERNTLARRLLQTAAHKLGRVAHANALYDRVDEVQYLLHELDDAARLHDEAAVSTLPGVSDEDAT